MPHQTYCAACKTAVREAAVERLHRTLETAPPHVLAKVTKALRHQQEGYRHFEEAARLMEEAIKELQRR